MLLVIDIGNTNIVLGLFENRRLAHSWRIATRRERTADEYAVLLRALFRADQVPPTSLEAVVVSSVVPPLNEVFSELGRRAFGLEPHFIHPEQQDLVTIRYQPISDVGADRIVTALAVMEMTDGPAIVVDFGTATTFDAVSANREYVGGVIAPGMGISAEALVARASRLPRIEIRRPAAVIGKSTITSMQSGLFFGYVALVEGILERMQRELGEALVVATGGFARLIAREARGIDRVEDNLMLYGLQLFHENMQTGPPSEPGSESL